MHSTTVVYHALPHKFSQQSHEAEDSSLAEICHSHTAEKKPSQYSHASGIDFKYRLVCYLKLLLLWIHIDNHR